MFRQGVQVTKDNIKVGKTTQATITDMHKGSTCPLSHVFFMCTTVSAAVEQGSMPEHSMVTILTLGPTQHDNKQHNTSLVEQEFRLGLPYTALPVRTRHH